MNQKRLYGNYGFYGVYLTDGEKMVIGVFTVELRISHANSLKEKRRVIKSIKDKSRNKFNVAVSEIDKHDVWKNAVLGYTTISNDKKYVDRLLNKIMNFMERNPEVEIIKSSVDII